MAAVKPPPLNGWMRFTYGYEYGPSTGLNVYWLAWDETEAESVDISDLDTLGAALDDIWLTRFSPILSEQLEMTEVRIVLYRASGEIAASYVFASGGAESGGAASAQVSIVANWIVNAYYRGGHPKSFLFGIPTAWLADERTVAGADAVSIATHLNNFRTDLEALTTTHLTTSPSMIVPSFRSGKTWRDTALQRHVVGVNVQERICTQRRRLGRPIS